MGCNSGLTSHCQVATLLGSARRSFQFLLAKNQEFSLEHWVLGECGAGSDCTSWGAGSAARKMGEAVLGHGNCSSLERVQELHGGVSGEVLKQDSEGFLCLKHRSVLSHLWHLILLLWTFVRLSQVVLLCSKSNNQLFRADSPAVFQKIT